MNWKIRRTKWGWSIFWQGELVASSNNPWALMVLTLQIQEVKVS